MNALQHRSRFVECIDTQADFGKQAAQLLISQKKVIER
jgi:hypothetical protein